MSRILETKGLVSQTYNILSSVRQPTQPEREALARKGFVFLQIWPKSLDHFVREKRGHFRWGTQRYVESQPRLTNYIPPQMDIAVDPTQFNLGNHGSNGDYGSGYTLKNEFLKKINNESQLIQAELSGARAIMAPATILAQADYGYSLRTGGRQPLFKKNCLVRALDDSVSGTDINVGRVAHRGLEVTEKTERFSFWKMQNLFLVGTLPVIVFV